MTERGPESGNELFSDSPGARVISQDQMNAISLWAESLRREIEELSEDVSLPFKRYGDAVEWLRSTSPGDPDEEFVDADGHRRLVSITLMYPTPDSEEVKGLRLNTLRAGRGSVRLRLKTEAARIARATGFREADVVRHILTGEDILVPLVKVTKKHYRVFPPVGEPISRTEVVVTFQRHEVTPKMLREINRYVRRMWGAEGVKSMTKNDERLLAVVRSLGDVPKERGQKVEFWETVLEKLWSTYQKKYASWRGPYEAHNRLQTKLERFRD